MNQIHPARYLTHILTSSHITPCHPVQALGVSRGESGLDGQLQRWDETVRASRFGVFVATRLGRQISMILDVSKTAPLLPSDVPLDGHLTMRAFFMVL